MTCDFICAIAGALVGGLVSYASFRLGYSRGWLDGVLHEMRRSHR